MLFNILRVRPTPEDLDTAELKYLDAHRAAMAATNGTALSTLALHAVKTFEQAKLDKKESK